MPMETVVVVAIAVLVVVFLGSLLTLILICQQRYCRKDFFIKLVEGPDANLIENNNSNNMELDDVAWPEFDQKIHGYPLQWVDDVTGLIPHCLAILKGCHHLTERLVASTMAMIPNYQEEEQAKKIWEISKVAQKVSPRVDEVVQAMYPPLDPRLLEARCWSLVLSVSHMALVIKYLCHVKSHWIEEASKELEQQMKVLREASTAVLEAAPNTQNGGVTNPGCTESACDSVPVV